MNINAMEEGKPCMSFTGQNSTIRNILINQLIEYVKDKSIFDSLSSYTKYVIRSVYIDAWYRHTKKEEAMYAAITKIIIYGNIYGDVDL